MGRGRWESGEASACTVSTNVATNVVGAVSVRLSAKPLLHLRFDEYFPVHPSLSFFLLLLFLVLLVLGGGSECQRWSQSLSTDYV